MHHFEYRNGVLHAEAVDLAALAQAVGTPLYCYSSATLERHYRVFAGAFAGLPALVCYSLKANSNQAVIRTLAALGAGADVVSEGELIRAQAAGIPSDKIMFSGVGKTARELALAVDAGILCVNVESEAELELLSSIAVQKGRHACVSVRVNPDIDAARMARSRPASRSRSAFRSAARARSRAGGPTAGSARHRRRHAHRQPDRRPRAVRRCVRAACRSSCGRCARDGHTISHATSGGGLGIPYREGDEAPPHPMPMPGWCGSHPRSRLHADLRAGRLIVANAGILLTRVIYLGGRRPDLRHRRRRHDRPDQAHLLRLPSRRPPSSRGAPGAPRSSPTSWGRSVDWVTFWRSAARFSGRSRAICWQ